MVRIAIVGGGSYRWTPTLLRDLAVRQELAGSRVVLHDIDPTALAEMHAWATARLLPELGACLEIDPEPRLDAALEGADVVVLQIAVGGLEAMRRDLEIPARHGIPQTVGDTVGPGGIARALRHVPVVLDVARAMERRCPEALLVNLTNPMAVLCAAVSRETRIRVLGLCHEVTNTVALLARILDVPREAIAVTVAGVNHLPWLTRIEVGGQDAYPRLGSLTAGLDTERFVECDRMPFLHDRHRVKLRLLELFGLLPAAGDRHLVEFFPVSWFLTSAKRRRYAVRQTTADDRYAWLDDFKARLRGPISELRSKEQLADVCVALATGRACRLYGDVPNRGQIPFLPDEAVVETAVRVDRARLEGVPAGVLPRAVRSVVERHVAVHELTLEAALTGDRATALEAMSLDPLVPDPAVAAAVLDELLEAHRDHLPQFAAPVVA